jgi:hypothetical protein
MSERNWELAGLVARVDDRHRVSARTGLKHVRRLERKADMDATTTPLHESRFTDLNAPTFASAGNRRAFGVAVALAEFGRERELRKRVGST